MSLFRIIWLVGTTLILILSIYWVVTENSPEPYIVLVGTILSYISFFWSKKSTNDKDIDKVHEKNEDINLSQKSGENSVNYQSGRDININNEK